MRVTDMKTKNGTVAMQWFLSPEGKMFRGRKSTLEHITKCGKYNVEDIRKFRCSGDTPTKSPYDWNDSDSSVPSGWKTTMITVNRITFKEKITFIFFLLSLKIPIYFR